MRTESCTKVRQIRAKGEDIASQENIHREASIAPLKTFVECVCDGGVVADC